MLVLGDSHASSPARRDALLSAYDTVDPAVALHVGDLEYYDVSVPTWFVAGNNEDFEVIDALRTGEKREDVRNVNLLASTATTVQGVRVAGLSGNFAPTRYDQDREELSGARRRHFTRSEVERAAALDNVDVFLTHEAPTGLFWFGYDPGCEHIRTLLETLDAKLCLVGHFHRHHSDKIAGVQTVALGPTWEQYYHSIRKIWSCRFTRYQSRRTHPIDSRLGWLWLGSPGVFSNTVRGRASSGVAS